MTIQHPKKNKAPIKCFYCRIPKKGARIYNSHSLVVENFRKYCKRCGLLVKEF